jgi:hypothetical protein
VLEVVRRLGSLQFDPLSVAGRKLLPVGPDCSTTPVATGLPAPTSVATGPDGDAYLSIFGTSAAIGQVVRVDLGVRRGDDENGNDGGN